MIRNSRKGFTLVEIMIVVAIIGILIAIAVPGFLKARENSRQKSCLENQQKIDGAVQQYILDSNAANQADAVTHLGTDITAGNAFTELIGDTNYVRLLPSCPSSGDYELQSSNFAVRCLTGGSVTGNGTSYPHGS